MKRGFLLSSSPSPSSAKSGGKARSSPPAGGNNSRAGASRAAPAKPKKSPEELQRERDAVIMSRLTIDQAIEYEGLREDITIDLQAVKNFEVREEHDKQAIDYLQRPDTDSKVWYCAGDFFIRLPKQKAESMVKRDLDQTVCEMEAAKERIQNKQQELEQLAK